MGYDSNSIYEWSHWVKDLVLFNCINKDTRKTSLIALQVFIVTLDSLTINYFKEQSLQENLSCKNCSMFTETGDNTDQNGDRYPILGV